MLDSQAACDGHWCMIIHRINQPLSAASPGVPMAELGSDWFGRPVDPPAHFALVRDPQSLWLLAAHGRPARPHPDAGAGEFREGLWQHDVAELFIASAARDAYLEFNLSPLGAWWFSAFRGPRLRDPAIRPPRVRTHAECLADGGWRAALGIPLDFLEATVGPPDTAAMNVTMILESPGQRFLSATALGAGEPDFHRPQRFAHVGSDAAP